MKRKIIKPICPFDLNVTITDMSLKDEK